MNPAIVDGEWVVPELFNFGRDVVEQLALENRERPAMTFVDSIGAIRRLTFHDIALGAARWSGLLQDEWLQRGDRLLVLAGKTPEWHMILLGALRLGVITVPCSEMLRAQDLAFRVRHAGVALIVADRSGEAELRQMAELLDDPPRVLYLDDAAPIVAGRRPPACAETWSHEPAFILYTSGTTKEPKGVTHTHGYTFAKRMQAEYWLDARPGDLVWCTAGTGWAKSIWNVLLGPWSCGAEVLLHDGGFDPVERFELLERLGVNVLCQAPTEYRLMAKLDDIERFDLRRLRHAVSAGEPLNAEVIQRFRDAFDLTIHDGYGQTENTLLVANRPGAAIRPGSMGLPTPGHDVDVIDEQGHPVPPGVEGDVALRGRTPTLFAGYWAAPEETDAAYRGDWYLTGDRATLDRDGYFWFTGRADDVILSAAYRIGPFEVESALLEHPAVAESAVVGKPDAERGQIVKAFVVLRPDAVASEKLAPDELALELQDHCKRVTAPYKYPREIEFVSELPKTRSGKIRRLELRQLEEARRLEGERASASAVASAGLLPPLPGAEPKPPPARESADDVEHAIESPAADVMLPRLEPDGGPALDAAPLEWTPEWTPEPWPEPVSTAPTAHAKPEPEPVQLAEPEPAPEPEPEPELEPASEHARAEPAPLEPEREPAAESSLLSRLRAYERRPGEADPTDPPFAHRFERPAETESEDNDS